MLNSSFPSWLDSVHHDGSAIYVSNLYPRLGETVRLRLRVSSRAPLKQPYLRTFPDGEQHIQPMQPGPHQPPARWWEADLKIHQPSMHYRFILQAEDGVWWYSAAGPSTYDPLDVVDFRILADYTPPDWVHQAIFYQIFPDRFANGEPANDPRPEEFEFHGHRPRTFPWGASPPKDQPFPIVFYGGDLQGVHQRLDYLQDLGVTALYLNPIFTAHSNHKYDVADYEHVDPHFGGDQALSELRAGLSQRGMRYILDIVPNHAGYWHPWFQAARADANASEAEFFTFNRHPEDYASWLGVWTLPKLNYRSRELRRRMYAGEDSVFRRWLRPPFAADGWRIDVANMLGRQGETQLGEEVVHGIRQAVKETRPDAYLMGENFFDASPQLQGNQLDAVMNYAGLTKPLWHWLRGFRQGSWGMKERITSPLAWPTQAVESAWRIRRAAIPWAVMLQQFNLVDSHDTERILTIAGNNPALQRLAAVIQFTYPGVPCLYYGDEIGLADHPELASRGCMPWDPREWDHELLGFYRRLIALRRQSPALSHGGFQMLLVEADCLAYQREAPAGRILVIAQRSPQARPAGPLGVEHAAIPEGTNFREYFSGQAARVAGGALPLPALPQGASLWIQETG
jgi:alpha-glucosidase